MPSNVTEKLRFLSGETSGLKSRIGKLPNAVQRSKLEMLKDIHSDYQQSLERASQRKAERVER